MLRKILSNKNEIIKMKKKCKSLWKSMERALGWLPNRAKWPKQNG